MLNPPVVFIIGTMPGPVLLGAIIDSSCDIWQHSCGVQGSCWVYDKSAMGVRVMLWFVGLKVCGAFLFLIASIVYKPPTAELSERNVQTISGASID